MLRLVFGDLDLMYLQCVRPHLVQGEVVVADGARGDHELLGVAADLDPASLHMESMVAHKLAGLDALGAHDARLEAVHHLAGRLFQCVAVLESPSSTTTDNLPMGFLIYPQRMYCKKRESDKLSDFAGSEEFISAPWGKSCPIVS